METDTGLEVIVNRDPSFFIGLIFGAANFWLLGRIIRGMVRAGEFPKWKTALYFVGKMLLLFVILGLILWKGYVTPLPFLGGFTVSLVLGLTVVILRGKREHHGT